MTTIHDTIKEDLIFFTVGSEPITIYTQGVPSVLSNVVMDGQTTLTNIEAGALAQELYGDLSSFPVITYTVTSGTTFNVNDGIDITVNGVAMNNISKS
jgi:hypothetical protein